MHGSHGICVNKCCFLPFAPTQKELTPPPPCATSLRVAVSLRGPGQSPVLPFACCVGSLRSVGRCGRCSRWCRCRVRGAQCWCAGAALVAAGCAVCASAAPSSWRPPHCTCTFPKPHGRSDKDRTTHPQTPLWDTDACARPVPSGTKQKCKAKVKEKSSSVTCHRRLSLQ